MDSWWQASREICQSDRCEQTEGGPRADRRREQTGGRTESEGKRRREGGREAEIDAGERRREGGEGRKKRDANVMRARAPGFMLQQRPGKWSGEQKHKFANSEHTATIVQ